MAKTTARTRPADIIVTPANPDVEALEQDGTGIRAFLGNLAAFFTRATELETKAKGLEAESMRLVEPSDVAADERMQTFIRVANAANKTVEEHWSICQAVSRLHRKLTARRGIAVTALETAASRAQAHHNAYAEKERRRAAQEQEAKRLEAERVAREQRAAEVAEMERKALEAEAASETLSEREKQFAVLVALGNSAEAAARATGYKDPATRGAKLLDVPKIKAAIEALRSAAEIRRQAEAVKASPLDVQVEEVKPQITHAGGHDRSSHSAELLNARLFLEAVVGGQHGIPLDCLTVDTAKLNEYARSMRELINRWPGVRYKKTTKTV